MMQRRRPTSNCSCWVAALVSVATSAAAVADRPAPAIVYVRSYDSTAPGAKPADERLGFIVESQGMILTGYQGLCDADSDTLRPVVRVQLVGADSGSMPAAIVSVEPTLNFAILKVENDEEEFPISVFAERDEIGVGQRVHAFGGVEDGRPIFVSGEISDLNSKECYQSSMTATMLRAKIEIPDASIGGPVFNDEGKVVAIHTGHQPVDELLPEPTGALDGLHRQGQAEDEGIQHILPIFLVATIYENIKLRKSLKSPWTGFSVRPINDEEKRRFPHTRYRSAVAVEEVWKGGPAEPLGIEVGDLLVGFSYYKTNTVAEFQRWLYAHGVGMDVKLIFLRGEDELRTVEFTIEERPKWAVPR